MVQASTQTEIDAFLKDHLAWRVRENELVRTIKTGDYDDSLTVAQRIGKLANEEAHHPALTIEWGSVEVAMTTHDVGNLISHRDIDMAEKIDSMFPTK